MIEVGQLTAADLHKWIHVPGHGAGNLHGISHQESGVTVLEILETELVLKSTTLADLRPSARAQVTPFAADKGLLLDAILADLKASLEHTLRPD